MTHDTLPHPLETFRYCPRCGAEGFYAKNSSGKCCPQCHFEFYPNTSASTALFILNEARTHLLVATRAKEPAKGTFDLPGGFIERGETAEEGALRELKEETGLEASHLRYLFSGHNDYLFSGHVVYTTDLFFLIIADSRTALTAQDDVAQLQWIPLHELRADAFGLHSISRAVQKIIQEPHWLNTSI